MRSTVSPRVDMVGPVDVEEALDALVRELVETLAGKASVEVDNQGVWIGPVNPRALGVGWLNWGDQLILEAGPGGRWELSRTTEDVAFLHAVVMAIAAGQAVEVAAPGRAKLKVSLANGSQENSSVAQAPVGCLPLPFWPRWGRQHRYEPY